MVKIREGCLWAPEAQCHPPLEAARVHTRPQLAPSHRHLPSSSGFCSQPPLLLLGPFHQFCLFRVVTNRPPSPEAVCLYKTLIGPNLTFDVEFCIVLKKVDLRAAGFYIHSKGERGWFFSLSIIHGSYKGVPSLLLPPVAFSSSPCFQAGLWVPRGSYGELPNVCDKSLFLQIEPGIAHRLSRPLRSRSHKCIY